MRLRHGFVWIVVLLAASLTTVAAHSGEHESEFGFLFGLGKGDSDLVGPGMDSELEPFAGVRMATRISDRWNWFLDYTRTGYDSDLTPFIVDTDIARTGAELLLNPDANWNWFVAFAGGYMQAEDDSGVIDLGRGLVSLGVGQRRITDGGFFRWEIRSSQTFSNNDLADASVYNAQALIGYSWGFGSRTMLDEDGDGVADRKDKCPGTPRGAEVDEDGCPMDSDGDGVYDGLDRCPDTPKGWPVDESGCPTDSDGDGVPDGRDKCPDTPKGAKVDEDGCPKDSDGDGVYDGLDKCPDTPKGWPVDAKGCPKDSDGDGVPDGKDDCPGTPRGTKVDDKGCPIPEKKKAEQLFTEEKKTLVLRGVNFELNSDALRSNSADILDKVAASLRDWPNVRVEIGGHTDSSGSAKYNQTLSERRANSVKAYLMGKGIDGSRLVTRGYGEEKPIADNSTEAGMAQNRRVELTKLD